MTTNPRCVSESGIYHITQRGAGRAIIYEDDLDRRTFLDVLAKVKERYGFELYAYCLMGNHNHLLARFEDNSLAAVMRDIGSQYALRFNERHGRAGHLFEERFRSKPVDSVAYGLRAARYILQNPMRCGLCEPQDYPWSSFDDYANTLSPGNGVRGLTDTAALIGETGSTLGFCEFVRMVDESDSRDFASWRKPGMTDDTEAAVAVAEFLDIASSLEVGQFDIESRNSALRKLKVLGIPPAQLARVTGVNRSAIYRA